MMEKLRCASPLRGCWLGAVRTARGVATDAGLQAPGGALKHMMTPWFLAGN